MNARDQQWPLGSTTVYGTLMVPNGTGPFPAVVMVAGSGPTDRDWNSPLLPGTNGSARLIAEALAKRGIASIRYDKRAAGPHAKETMLQLIGKVSMQSHLDELAGAVAALAVHPQVRRDRIFGFGNSEGTLHLLNYQLSQPAVALAGLVLTGMPGRTIGDVARSQLAAQLAPVPNGAEIMRLYDAAAARFAAEQPIDPDPSLPPSIQALLKSLETPMNLPFTRELWSANPSQLLGRVDVPTLVVIGKKDVQIDWEIDGAPL
ncbi:MAG: hypothetical protein U0163_05320, partial [Gemmatimonadaceae bacterium]